MGAVAAKTFADLRRRRLQAVVLGTVLFLASAAATLATSILLESTAPFDRAFERANGAHLVIDFDPSVSDSQLAATTDAAGVVASAGPWPVSSAAFLSWNGAFIADRVVSGRSQPDGSIDAVTMIAGRWWQAPGEAVLEQDTVAMLGLGVGDTVSLYPQPSVRPKPIPMSGDRAILVPGQPEVVPDPLVTLTVVGVAASVSTPDVALWSHPDDVAAVRPDAEPARQMLYHVTPSATAADLTSATAAIAANLDAHGVVDTLTYLETKTSTEDIASLYVPVLLAFSVFALLAAAFTIANVVSGVVLTSYRDIGVMKAIGFTPNQITTILLGQILLPVAIGTVAGVAAGTFASRPTVEATAQSFGLPASFVPSVPAVLGVFVISLVVSLGAAVVPAVHAGRLSAVGAITRGTAPSNRPGGGRLRRLALRMPGPIPVRLGVASGAAHPVRATMTLGAVLVGVAAVVFAIGLNLSLLRVMSQLSRDVASPVRAVLVDENADPVSLTTTMAALPGTGALVSIGQGHVTNRLLGQVQLVAYDGDSASLGYELIHGRWFSGPGEVVAPTVTFDETGLEIGDVLELAGSGGSIEVRLVGEILDMADQESDGYVLRGAWSDLQALEPELQASQWEARPSSGVEPHELAAAIRTGTSGQVQAYTQDNDSTDEEFLLFLSVVTFMGIVLVAISLGGVFNTVLLETRQRTREMAVLKAVGLTPVQVVTMVVSSVVPVGLVAGLLGVPLGLVFQRAVLGYLGQTAGKTAIPESTFDVFGPILLVGLALAGLLIAATGAYLPAQRAARARIAPVLQAE